MDESKAAEVPVSSYLQKNAGTSPQHLFSPSIIIKIIFLSNAFPFQKNSLIWPTILQNWFLEYDVNPYNFYCAVCKVSRLFFRTPKIYICINFLLDLWFFNIFLSTLPGSLWWESKVINPFMYSNKKYFLHFDLSQKVDKKYLLFLTDYK